MKSSSFALIATLWLAACQAQRDRSQPSEQPGKMRDLSMRALLILALALMTTQMTTQVAAAPLRWQSYDTGLEQARSKRKILLVQFYADWCHDCHKMESEIKADPRLSRLLQEHFVLARVDWQSKRQIRYQGELLSEDQLSRKLLVQGPPTWLLVSGNGRQLGRIIGYTPTSRLKILLESLLSKQGS